MDQKKLISYKKTHQDSQLVLLGVGSKNTVVTEEDIDRLGQRHHRAKKILLGLILFHLSENNIFRLKWSEFKFKMATQDNCARTYSPLSCFKY